jgi:hypothetical protein
MGRSKERKAPVAKKESAKPARAVSRKRVTPTSDLATASAQARIISQGFTDWIRRPENQEKIQAAAARVAKFAAAKHAKEAYKPKVMTGGNLLSSEGFSSVDLAIYARIHRVETELDTVKKDVQALWQAVQLDRRTRYLDQRRNAR